MSFSYGSAPDEIDERQRTNDSDPDISIVVPVYKSEEMLRELSGRLERVAQGRPETFELILVCDGSPDGSWGVIESLNPAGLDVVGIRLSRNYGQHNALLAGIRAARGDLIVTIDDDLQHPPEEIPVLLEALTSEFDVVYGHPRKLPHSGWRNLTSWLTKLTLSRAMGAETARRASAFRAFRTPLRRAFADYQAPYVSIDALLTWGTFRFRSVMVDHHPRKAGRSNYTFWKLFTNAMTMMTGFSTLPLRITSAIGLFFTLFGLAVLVWVLGRYFIQGGAVPGFPFIASTIAIFSGAQLFALGIMGEYLARIHLRTMDQPPYLVSEVAGSRSREAEKSRAPQAALEVPT